MRVIVGAIPGKLHPRTVPAILEAGYDVEVFDVSGGDQRYYDVLRDVWAAGDTFVTIEHDVEVSPEMIRGLVECWAPWCAHSYRVYWGGLMDVYPGSAGLGCTKFSWDLIQKHPNLFDDDIPSSTYENGRDGRFWMNLDGTVSQWLKGPYGYTVHRHNPDVTHHHSYDYEGAWLPDSVRERLPADHPLHALSSTPPLQIGSTS